MKCVCVCIEYTMMIMIKMMMVMKARIEQHLKKKKKKTMKRFKLLDIIAYVIYRWLFGNKRQKNLANFYVIDIDMF